MDFSKFLDDDFDAKDWVNSAFKQNTNDTNEHYATTLIMKIQMFIQEVNNVIDESCQREVKNLSRTLSDIDAVYQESALLNEQMNIVKQDIEKVDKNTSQSMQMLVELDRLKCLMNTTCDALQEADNWTTLSVDVEEVFESKDINIISEKLIGMQQSLAILVDVPDYAERCQYLEELKNRLETMASTQIVEAFTTQSSDTAQVYMRIFSKIGRESQLVKYYNKCQKEKLQPLWKVTCDKYADETISECLSEFYDILLSTFHVQVQWCTHIFPEPALVVGALLTDILTSIHASVTEGLQQYIALHEAQGELVVLNNLMQVKQLSERFIRSIKKALLGYVQIEKDVPDLLHKLGVAVFTPYKPCISLYEQYELSILMDLLQQISPRRDDFTENSEHFLSVIGKIFDEAEKAYDRCMEFTNGVALDSLLKSMQTYFDQHIRDCKQVIQSLKSRRKGEVASVDALDWTWFQYALKIIEMSGELIIRAEELDQKLVTNIIKSLGKLSTLSQVSGTTLDQSVVRHGAIVEDFPALLLTDDKVLHHLVLLAEELKAGEQPSVLSSAIDHFHQFSELAHQFAYDIVSAPLHAQLEDIATMEVWTQQSAGGAVTTNLPTYSITPQEYITKIGQYLMTLPQQLEPFSTEDNAALTAAVRWGKLPHINQQDNIEHISDLWLESVAQGTMHRYMEKVLQIQELSSHATKQLITDIEYFSNVLEDLGYLPSPTLTEVDLLLKTPEGSFSAVASDKPQRIVSAVSRMRSLKK